MPVAIHCEAVTEPYRPCASFGIRWIAASDYRLPRNDTTVGQGTLPYCHRDTLVIARAQPVAIHCEPIREALLCEEYANGGGDVDD